MKKRVVLIIVLVCLGAYFGFKAYLLNKYKVNEEKVDTSLIFKDTISVEKSDVVAENEIKVGDLVIANYFSNYVEKEYDNSEESIKGVIFKSFKLDDNTVLIGKYPQFIDLLTSRNVGDEDDIGIVDIDNKADFMFKVFVKLHNVKNDIDFLKYVKEHYYAKSSLISTIGQIKNNYIINEYGAGLKDSLGVSLITGDLTGYMVAASSKRTEIYLLHDDEQYIIALVGESIADADLVKGLLSSISFDSAK